MSFVAFICLTYRDSPYKQELGRDTGRTPSSKPAALAAEDARLGLAQLVLLLAPDLALVLGDEGVQHLQQRLGLQVVDLEESTLLYLLSHTTPIQPSI
jgi:hypothetical protein